MINLFSGRYLFLGGFLVHGARQFAVYRIESRAAGQYQNSQISRFQDI
jgi:hypothetical protein